MLPHAFIAPADFFVPVQPCAQEEEGGWGRMGHSPLFTQANGMKGCNGVALSRRVRGARGGSGAGSLADDLLEEEGDGRGARIFCRRVHEPGRNDLKTIRGASEAIIRGGGDQTRSARSTLSFSTRPKQGPSLDQLPLKQHLNSPSRLGMNRNVGYPLRNTC